MTKQRHSKLGKQPQREPKKRGKIGRPRLQDARSRRVVVLYNEAEFERLRAGSVAYFKGTGRQENMSEYIRMKSLD